MNKQNLTLFIVEGPAGSGKSYQIKSNSDLWKEVPRVAELPRPRSYDGLEGIMLSHLKDTQTAVSLAYQDWNQVHVVDRWVLSQLVYGALRGKFRIHSGLVYALIQSGIQNIAAAVEERMIRSHQVPGPTRLDLHLEFLILLPEPDSLIQQRVEGKKEYPYSARDEISMYRMLADILHSQDIAVHSFTFNTENRMKMNDRFRLHLQSEIAAFTAEKTHENLL